MSKSRYIFTKHSITFISRFYCSDKPKNIPEILLKKPKSESIQAAEIIPESYDQCLKFEEKVLKDIVVEKEKEANIQSRLAKECRTLFNAPLNKTNFKKYGSIHLEQISFSDTVVCKSWDTYNFERLEKKLGPSCESTSTSSVEKKGQIEDVTKGGGDKGGKNLSNRPVRQEPGKVIACLIPVEWWHIFFQKSGVTGFGTFLFTFLTFLISKEIYVLEHYYYQGIAVFFLWVGFIKYVGPVLAKYLDNQIDEFEKSWNKDRVNAKKCLEDSIVHDLYLQFQMEGQLMIVGVKRENVQLQLEEEFRQRQMHVHNEVLKRLNYQVEFVHVHQRIQHKNLIDYVTKEVVKAITPDMQDRLIYYSIDRIIEDIKKDEKK